MMWLQRFNTTRENTEKICRYLETEDYVVQPVVDVSPPKWHLGHSTWFFETFLLKPHLAGYKEFDPNFNFVFNSYYETIGSRVIRTDRGNLSRPTVAHIYEYRKYVNEAMQKLLSQDTKEFEAVLELGLNHEEQHQELLYTDIKYILGHNPLFPAYSSDFNEYTKESQRANYLTISEGKKRIGFEETGFCFDNELSPHDVWLAAYNISSTLVTNGQYLEFITDKGYQDFRHWHAEGWDWVKVYNISAPLYWHQIDGRWMYFTMGGLKELDLAAPLCHVSFYEASAFAAWANQRLPTEFEWETASAELNYGLRWEWTESAYLPYPGYKKAPGAIGEYNGKFMVNQMVLRGSSVATPNNHSRKTYRNFFHPYLRWQFNGIRLCKKHGSGS